MIAFDLRVQLARDVWRRFVPNGANKPCPAIDSNPTTPLSAIVGTCGNSGLRFDDVTAIAFTLPPMEQRLRCGTAREGEIHLATNEVVDGRAGPFVGNVHDLRAGNAVELLERQVIRRTAAGRGHVELAGCGLSAATTSASELNRELAGAIMMSPNVAMLATGIRSFA